MSLTIGDKVNFRLTSSGDFANRDCFQPCIIHSEEGLRSPDKLLQQNIEFPRKG